MVFTSLSLPIESTLKRFQNLDSGRSWKKNVKKTAARKNPILLPCACTAAAFSSNEVNSTDGTHNVRMEEKHTSVVGTLLLAGNSEAACTALELIIMYEQSRLLKHRSVRVRQLEIE